MYEVGKEYSNDPDWKIKCLAVTPKGDCLGIHTKSPDWCLGKGAESHGEVYEIDDPDLIRRLDLIEGAYTRTKFEKFEAYVLKPIYRVLDHKNNIRFIEEANYYEWINS